MKTIVSIAKKDILILFRDKGSLFWVIGFPMLYALFIGTVFSGSGGSMSGMKIAVADLDGTEYSQRFVAELDSLSSTRVSVMSRDSAFNEVRRGNYVACVVLKVGFGATRALFGDSASIQIGIDPARQAESGYLRGMLAQTAFTLLQDQYLSAGGIRSELGRLMQNRYAWGNLDSGQYKMATGFLENLAGLMESWQTDTLAIDSAHIPDTSVAAAPRSREIMPLDIVEVTREGARPRSSFEIFFPSALLWALIACAASFAVSIVKERTAGTLLRLRLAPVTRAHILGGKGLACFLSCLAVCLTLLTVGNIIFGVRIGDFVILALALVANAIAFVGMMMLISVLGRTEEAVGGAGWAILLVMAMAGGAMVPSFIMPNWLQTIGSISPVKWGIRAFEAGIWRDYSYSDMMLPVGILLTVGIIGYSLGVAILSRADG
jgi:ABC-2 type transport system permease protein